METLADAEPIPWVPGDGNGLKPSTRGRVYGSEDICQVQVLTLERA